MKRRVKRPGANEMGRFAVELELSNNRDLLKAEDGELPSEKVRRVRVRGIVDTGATRLVIPKATAVELGLKITGKVGVRYADGRRAIRPVVDNVHLSLLGRSSVFKAAVEPKRESALIGAIVLEDLDFLVDPQEERLRPRDPRMIISEAESSR
jgi:predicted aspartyl protease